MSRWSLASVLLGAVLFIACGGAPAIRAPDAPLAIPPSPALAARPAAPAPRPEKTSLWLHIEDPSMLVLMFSALTDSAKSAGVPTDEYSAILETVDLGRPIDAALSLHKKNDLDAAVRVSFRDSKAFFKLLSEKFTLREEGDRIRIAKQNGAADLDAKPDDENANDVVVCEFEARAADTAVCGTAHGVELFRDWLRTSPRPPSETQRSKSPIVQAVVYAASLRHWLERELSDVAGDDADDASELRRVVEDADSLALELGRNGLSIAFSAEAHFRASTSTVVKDLLTPMNAGDAPEAFSRLSEETSAALFSPGGGPLPRWVKQLMDSGRSTPDAARAKTDAASVTLSALARRPFAAAYGVHLDRAKAAVAAVRAAKDPAKEKKILEQALDTYGTFALSVDVATVERAARELIAAEAAAEAAKAKLEPTRRGVPAALPARTKSTTVRIAASNLGLPKGSFFVDETKPDDSGASAKVKKTKVESTLFVPGAGPITWGFLGDDEKTLVESAKKVSTPLKVAAPPLDPILRQPGVIVAGYLSSQVGAFAMHSLTSALSSQGSPTDDLAELEKDLSARRLPIPFALTAQKRAEGGVVRFEAQGQPEAFKTVAEHLGGIGAGTIALVFYALLMAGP